MQRSLMDRVRNRYAFVATGNVARNASFVRLREFGRQLAERDLDVHYLLDKETTNASGVASSLDFATVHLADGASRIGRLCHRRRQLASIATSVVHILNPQPGNCAAIAASDIPLVGDWDELLSARNRTFFQRQTDLFCESYARRRATVTVVASRWLQTYMQERCGVSSLYLPYAAYLPYFPDGDTPFPEPTAVYMGNLMPDFDHDLIVDAWEILQKRGNRLKLCMLGGGPLLESVRADVQRRNLSNINVMGYMSGQPLWDRLRHAHVLLFPIRDTVGNRARCPSKTFAYMQAKRPIITNRIGEVAEALGDLATYVRPEPKAFADAAEQASSTAATDVAYPLEAHQWSTRAATLLDRLAHLGILNV